MWTQSFLKQANLTPRNKHYYWNDAVWTCPDMDCLLVDLNELAIGTRLAGSYNLLRSAFAASHNSRFALGFALRAHASRYALTVYSNLKIIEFSIFYLDIFSITLSPLSFRRSRLANSPEQSRFALIYACCASMLSASRSKLVLLPLTDHYLSNFISFIYVPWGGLELWAEISRFALVFARCARNFCASYSKIDLLPSTDNYLIWVLSMYVLVFLSYEPKTCNWSSFFRAARPSLALGTRN